MALSLLPRDYDGLAGVPRAPQACSTCKKQKRKCDKVLPACSLCARMNRPCDYSEITAAPTADDFAALQMKLAMIEARLDKENSSNSPSSNVSKANARGPLWLPGLSKFPSVVFLDIDAFRWAGVMIPKPPVDIPSEVLEVLSDGEGVQEAVSSYFSTVHIWFPIISKKRMNLGIPLWDGGPDLAMLFLAMKLITTPPVEGLAAADHPLYAAAKRFVALLESSGTISMLYLQAMILVALYEFGHSIYPAAWMTIGSCARYAQILGIPSYSDSCLVLGQCTTWTEAEERRRAWWAVYILDRAISLGTKKGFALQEPTELDALPVDDIAWDEGDMARAFQRRITTPLSERQGPFTRLAQVCVLLSRTMTYIKMTRLRALKGEGDAVDIAEVARMTDELAQLCRHIDDELNAQLAAETVDSSAFFARIAPRCLVWSTVIMILDAYSCPETMREQLGTSGPALKTEAELAMQVEAIDGLRKSSDRIRQFGQTLLEFTTAMTPAELGRVSPLILDSMYCAMATFHWLWKEGGGEDVEQALDDVKATLRVLTSRWRLADEYLAIEEHHDVTTMMAIRAGGHTT